ncbi:DUF397 domain-containing protein [Streptomyces sp. NPDC088768]|uniref:DUF397 domain-containing protein n=1 Tax=Streptomyces sp. NPDC088768 TaxID=3365894 RepID=UPI003814D799
MSTPRQLTWRKSSYSNGGNSNCLEVAVSAVPGVLLLRDSKAPAGPVLRFSPRAFTAFTRARRDAPA